jgi:hypothetical protein
MQAMWRLILNLTVVTCSEVVMLVAVNSRSLKVLLVVEFRIILIRSTDDVIVDKLIIFDLRIVLTIQIR